MALGRTGARRKRRFMHLLELKSVGNNLFPMSPALYVYVPLATCVGLCRFGEAWAALRAENLLTYLGLL